MNVKKIICAAMFCSLIVSAALPINANADDLFQTRVVSDSNIGIVSSMSSADMNAFYNGSNVNAQNYINNTRWSKPIDSYLSSCPDGKMLRFQNTNEGNCYLAEYYNSGLARTKSVLVPKELEIFGGFFNAGDCYVVITGSENSAESDKAEVVRITKYDTNWNKISSDSLYGANTVGPFEAGSLRMARCGDYILIRTSHKMFKYIDGKNHQSNMTIQYHIPTAKITDSFTDIKNNLEGYVSHSFNQFINVENGNIVAVDHGDASPRSIALVKYTTDCSNGKFKPDPFKTPCTVIDAVKIKGNLGENDTGVSLGGFECSDSNYLIAGNIVADPQDYKNGYAARNVFIASVDKKTDNVKMNYITRFTKYDNGVDNPQFAKIGDNRFILLWTRCNNSKVYYTEIDGSGNVKGETYEMDANLSDCKPEVIGNKLTWYVWNGKNMIFYSIDLKDISKNYANALNYDQIVNANPIYGDMDDDGNITAGDSLTVLRASVGLENLDELYRELADVDSNGTISSADALEILRFSVSLPTKSCCGQRMNNETPFEPV